MLLSDPQRALITVMMLVSASDGEMTDAELHTIAANIRYLPVFDGFDLERLPQTAASFSEALADDDGLDRLLSEIDQALPAHLHETAYALAVEVAASDRRPSQEALRLLELLQDKLHVDALAAAAIERAARARHIQA